MSERDDNLMTATKVIESFSKENVDALFAQADARRQRVLEYADKVRTLRIAHLVAGEELRQLEEKMNAARARQNAAAVALREAAMYLSDAAEAE